VFVVPSTVTAGAAEGSAGAGGVLLSVAGVAGVPLLVGGVVLPSVAGEPLFVGGVVLPLVDGAPVAGDAEASVPVLGGVTSPAAAELVTAGVGSLAGADVAETATTAPSATTEALVTLPAAALIVGEAGAGVATTASALEAADKVADAAAGARMVVWEETERTVLPDTRLGTGGIAGTLGIGMVIETAEGMAPAFAALNPGVATSGGGGGGAAASGDPPAEETAAAAAAMSAGESCLVVLLKKRVVSFMLVAGSRFS
jgi:hypothetical protein